MKNITNIEVSIICFCIIITVFQTIEATPICSGTQDSALSGKCTYGTYTDWFHQKQCAKGPGQRCGGTRNILGDCGCGMYCNCNRCTGCATTLECYPGIIC